MALLGGAGNVAFNLAALRAKVVPFGVVGRDLAGEALLERLRELGMRSAVIIAEGARPTTLKTRIIARHQQIVRVDREVRAPISANTEDKLGQQTGVVVGKLGTRPVFLPMSCWRRCARRPKALPRRRWNTSGPCTEDCASLGSPYFA